MNKHEHFRKLERMYLSAPCNEHYNPSMSISKGRAEVTVPIREAFFHAAGATHGSVYFKVMDDAAFFACNSLIKDFFVLTVHFEVYLIRPIATGVMRGIGQVVSRGREIMIAESMLFDSRNREIGRGTGSFVKSKIRISSDMGYR